MQKQVRANIKHSKFTCEYASKCMCAFKYARMGVKRKTYKIKIVSTFYYDSSIKVI